MGKTKLKAKLTLSHRWNEFGAQLTGYQSGRDNEQEYEREYHALVVKSQSQYRRIDTAQFEIKTLPSIEERIESFLDAAPQTTNSTYKITDDNSDNVAE